MDTELFLRSGALITLSPGNLLVGWGERVWSAAPGQFYFPDFFLKEPRPWFSHEYTEVVSTVEVEGEPFRQEWEEPSFEVFRGQFEELQRRIGEGRLQKGVPYTFSYAKGQMNRERLKGCLAHLLRYAQNRPVFVYGFWDERGGILGATPERLFSMEEGVVKSAAVAGTGGRGIAQDPKEVREHQFVIDGIKEALAPFGKVKVGKTEVVEYTSLCHLVTPIELHAQVEFDALVQALHPTPALGTYPRERKWLEHYQTILPRGRFGAPVGHKGGCYVAIRNMQWDEERWQIGAGCGVVKESELEREWRELKLKIGATRQILAI